VLREDSRVAISRGERSRSAPRGARSRSRATTSMRGAIARFKRSSIAVGGCHQVAADDLTLDGTCCPLRAEPAWVQARWRRYRPFQAELDRGRRCRSNASNRSSIAVEGFELEQSRYRPFQVELDRGSVPLLSLVRRAWWHPTASSLTAVVAGDFESPIFDRSGSRTR